MGCRFEVLSLLLSALVQLSLLSIAFSGINSIGRAERGLEHLYNLTIVHNKHSKTRCSPTFACEDINALDIPYLFEHVSPDFAKDNHGGLYDMEKTRKCLKRKRVLLLGDSTMSETFHDLSILLSGAANSLDTKRDSHYLDNYIKTVTTHQEGLEDETWRYDVRNDVYIMFYCCRRNMTVFAPDNTEIHFRFTGHYNLKENYGGVGTLLSSHFRDELDCMLGFSHNCAVPDIVIINSGLHDRDYSEVRYKEVLSEFFKIMLRGYGSLNGIRSPSHPKMKKVPKVYWKGNLLGCENRYKHKADLRMLDKAADDIVKKFKIPFMNVTDILNYVPRYQMK